MTNEEVKKSSDADRILKILESAKDKNGDVPMSIVRKAFDKLLPYAQSDLQSTCNQLATDTISRQAAIEAIERIFDRCEEIEAHLPEGDPDRVGYKMYPDWLTVWKYLHQVPSAQPERKTGRWIYNSPVTMRCDQCGYVVKDWEWSRANYCAGCGRAMGRTVKGDR